MEVAPEQKTRCTKCGAEVLQATATRTSGLCMPCHLGRPPRPDSAVPVEVSCAVGSDQGQEAVIYTSAQDLLAQLEQTRHVGDSKHANRLELEAQRALLRHAIRHGASFRLHDDHWRRTSYALLGLFEQGKATLCVHEQRLTFAAVTKEEWREGSESLASHGGFLYRAADGSILFQRTTWVS